MEKIFSISEERLQTIGQDFLLLGQQHKLEPYELCIVCDMMKKWLQVQCGIELKETTIVDDNFKNEGH